MKNISYLRIFLGEFRKDIVTTINTIDYVLIMYCFRDMN